MKLRATPGRLVARGPLATVGQQIGDTQRAVRELASNAGVLTGAVIRRGLLTIRDNGGLSIRALPYAPFNNDTGEFSQFLWGVMPDDPLYNRPDGARQMAWLAYRDDKTLAMAIAELNAGDGLYSQAVLWFDRSGNIIVSEDTTSGRGLARPHLGQFAGNGDTNIARWPSTTNTTYTAIWSQYWEVQNPKLSWNTQIYAPAGCVGQWRLLYDGNQLGESDPLNGSTTGMFGQWFGSRVLLPGDIGDEKLLTVEARITAGSGQTCFNWLQLKGDQS